jgi:hypothetical protein
VRPYGWESRTDWSEGGDAASQVLAMTWQRTICPAAVVVDHGHEERVGVLQPSPGEAGPADVGSAATSKSELEENPAL